MSHIEKCGDNVICIFVYLSFLWNIFIRLPDIVSGVGAASYVGNQIADIRTAKVTGYRPSTYKNKRTINRG